jgi:type I restriction enzyme S subunit
MAFNQDVKALRPKNGVEASFLPYILRGNKKRLLDLVDLAGHGTGRLNTEELKSLVIGLPSLSDQKAIAAILSALDDKIELNRRMNATLEAMARTLFKSWFIDFDPVRAKSEGRQPFSMDAETAALFPSRFVPSALGDIPEGWEAKPLGSVVEPQKGKSITRKTVSEGNVPVVAGGLEPAYYHDISNAQAPAITISASGANAGFVRLYHEDIWASDCSCINKSHTAFVYSIYSLLKNRQKEIYGMQQGAAQPHIYPSDIMRLEIVNAPLKIWQALEESVQPLFEKITANCSQNKSLESVRDYLLPKLVSGDIRIPDATKFVEAA